MSGNLGEIGALHNPRSVQQITKAAQDYEYDASIPLRYWLRSAQAMLKEADIYIGEGDDETTYLLLFRHAHLILSQIPAHPQFKDKATRAQLKDAEDAVNRNLKILDLLKPRINQRHDHYVKILKERESRRAARSLSRSTSTSQPLAEPLDSRTQRLHAHENKDLAVKIAQKEFLRRAATRQAVLSNDGEDLSTRLQELRSRLEGRSNDSLTSHKYASSTATAFNYPAVRPNHMQEPPWPLTNLDPPRQDPRNEGTLSPPALPPKSALSAPETLPPRPQKISEHLGSKTGAPEPAHIFAPAAYLENGAPLRTIFLPPTLRTTFLRIAQKNTTANLETCGFLAGTLIANAFFISRLIIPSQTASSDTCEMTNESQLFDYVDSEDLMILGWIHTHPTQTCFMSSRDLHTHAGYQMMLAESIAIVCAPSKGDTYHGGDWGAYRLTDPPGKKAILNCDKPGIFHPHEVDNIYTDALRPGHVVEAKGMEFEVVDLRNQ
ncbi:hypothetical protein PV10_00036 [Exophiala mesophila]|uniref:MPN domain-containing protein n=1 Tax=Exophiala mesophila TaxID=212818 RepID=A0A0D1ZND1_EXOME|nr:uncharacterized protein PV10_00036 [Exophiala mesophila]KIV96132.1 hypothetical protein PV10_00036 [Exophiala mesophila]